MADIEPVALGRRTLAAIHELASALVEDQFVEITDRMEQAAAVAEVENSFRTLIDSQIRGWEVTLSSPD